MRYLIDLLTREFNRIRGLQLGLCAGRRSDAHASSVDTDTSVLNAECCNVPHNKKLKLLEDTECDFDELNYADANRNVNHELLLEIIAYLDPVRLNNEEKLCTLLL